MNKTKVAFHTFGCQMNLYDTEVAQGLLANQGYEITSTMDDGAPDLRLPNETDVVIMNTCSVREHAEERVFGRLGMLGKAKKSKPEMIIGLMGCMVEEHREKLFRRFPQLDIMVGTRNIKELPALIDEVRRTRKRVSRIKQDGIGIEYTDLIQRQGGNHAWLPGMTSCNKVCTFCVAPITRGAEVSMTAREIYREAARLAGEGVTWITLLGQNVNSYDGAGPVAGVSGSNFPELLDMLCQIEGLKRISFTTSHPHDATEELYKVIARNPKISRRFHLPLQSGSDKVLKRMKRLHTFDEYAEKIRLMRELIPDISITTDIITGFCGETDEDHAASLRALELLRYDSAYIFRYSVRPGTPASKLADDVPITIKEKRNAELLGLQRQVTQENNQSLIGQTVEVFVEDTSSKNAAELVGITHQEKKVIFPGEKTLLGSFQKIRVEALKFETFTGSLT